MQIIVGKEQMVSSLAKVQSIVERRSAMPILEHVSVRIDGGKAIFTTTDMDIMVSDTFVVNSDISCSFTTPAQPLYEIVRKLYGCDEILLNLKNEDKLIITGGAGRFNLPCLSDTAFPSFDDSFDGSTHLVLQAEHLHSLLSQTKHAISSGETRYYLNGAYLHQHELGHLTVVATDAHRLAKADIDLSNTATSVLGHSVVTSPPALTNLPGVIIPRKTVFELIKLLESNKSAQVGLWITDRKIKFIIGSTTIISKLIDAKFPDYQAPLAQISAGKELEVNVKELMRAIDLVVSVLEDKVKKVKLTFEQNQLTISVENQISHHASGIQLIPIKYDDGKIEVLLNARYITDCLSVIRGENAVITLNSSVHPIVVKDTQDHSSMYVLMPMQLGDGDTARSTG